MFFQKDTEINQKMTCIRNIKEVKLLKEVHLQ